VRDLGSGVFVAWRSRLAHGRPALFARLDEHARRIRADAATTLADDGRAGGSRRDATVRCEHGVPFLGDAGVLVNAHRARAAQQRLTRDGSQGGYQSSAALRYCPWVQYADGPTRRSHGGLKRLELHIGVVGEPGDRATGSRVRAWSRRRALAVSSARNSFDD